MDTKHPSPSLKTKPFSFTIIPCSHRFLNSLEFSKHLQGMTQVLQKLIPESLLFEDQADAQAWLKEQLPMIKWTENLSPPDCMSIYLFCYSSKGISTGMLFQNLLTRSLPSEKKFDLLSFQHLEFYIREIKGEKLFVAEAKILIETPRDYQHAVEMLSLLAKEVEFNMYSAAHFIDNKPLKYDQKIIKIHEGITERACKFSHLFTEELLEEMSLFLSVADKEFKATRSSKHLIDLICAQYFTKQKLHKALRSDPDKRHLFSRLLCQMLHFPFGIKPVLGLMISINLQDEQEFFREKHVVQAVQTLIPSAQSIQGSFYLYQKHNEQIQVLYLELEKKNGERFSTEEKRLLRKRLPEELKRRVEKLVSSVTVVRNEEEAMKIIFTLRNEIKSPKDQPQITLKFEEQTACELIFSIVIVRVIEKSASKFLFSQIGEKSPFLIERYQILEKLGRNHVKEASMLRLAIPKDSSFFRSDFSINLHLARQTALSLIQDLVGKVRDYTGGLISEQEKRYAEFQNLFQNLSSYHAHLLEMFFHSLTPIESQCVLALPLLKQQFEELLLAVQTQISDRKNYYLKFLKQANHLSLTLRAEASLCPMIQSALMKFRSSSNILATTSIPLEDSICLSFLFLSSQQAEQEAFIEAVKQAINIWRLKLESQKTLRLTTHDLRSNLDPRLVGGDRECSVILKMLFDGLTRIGHDGKPQLAIAQSVDISKDQKRYLFKLRNTLWSDGSPLTAYDFEYAWKKILHPDFQSPFSSLFYPLKNGKFVKEGLVPVDKLGVQAYDDTTLLVELESAVPYFLELTANALYFPVHHAIDKKRPDWASQHGENYICNGPFILKKRSSTQYELEKNFQHWDASSVRLDQIVIYKTDPYDAMKMFLSGKIDWIGRPLRPWEPFFSQSLQKTCHLPTSMVHWCVFNVEYYPLNHLKVRQALAAAICREEILQVLSDDMIPAFSPLPKEYSQLMGPGDYKENQVESRRLFDEALTELGLTKETFPVLTFICLKGNIRETTALTLKRQWEATLGIYCRIEVYDWHTLFDKMTKGNYQIGGMTWKSWIDDPIYTLAAFKYKKDQINFSKWENTEYCRLLDKGEKETDPSKRSTYFTKAEALLIKEMPLIPIYYELEKFSKSSEIDISLNTAQLDFKWVQFNDKTIKEI